MAHLYEVCYAARDNFSGGGSLVDETPFLNSGSLNIIGSQDSELEGMLIEIALTIPHPNRTLWIEQFSLGLPIASQLGHDLFASKQLHVWKEEARGVSFVIDQLGLECAKPLSSTK